MQRSRENAHPGYWPRQETLAFPPVLVPSFPSWILLYESDSGKVTLGRQAQPFQPQLAVLSTYCMQTLLLNTLLAFSSRTVVPNIFGPRNLFHGRQLFQGPAGRGDGSGGNASDGELWGAADEASLALLPLTSCCAVRFQTGHRPVLICGPGVGDLWSRRSAGFWPELFHFPQEKNASWCPSLDELDKEHVVYIYNGILFSHKKVILPFAKTWMDLEGIMLSEITRMEKDKCCMISLTCET